MEQEECHSRTNSVRLSTADISYPRLEAHLEELEQVAHLSFEVLSEVQNLHRRYTGEDNPPQPSPNLRDDSFCAVMECNIVRLRQNLNEMQQLINII